MGLYTKWGRKKMKYAEGMIFGIFLILLSLFIFIYPIVMLIINHKPWYEFIFVILLCLYISYAIFSCGCLCIEQGLNSRKRPNNDYYDIS